MTALVMERVDCPVLAGIAGQLPPKRRDMTSKTRGIRR
jgi:hypothetical protein